MDNYTVSDKAAEGKVAPKRMPSPETDKALDVGDSSKKMKPDYHTECFPITSLDKINEVLDNPPAWIARTVPLRKRSGSVVQNTISDCHVELKNFVPKVRLDKRFLPKTLVCHDYKGGYLEDRFLTGSNVGNLYTFYNWDHIDIFVYFSHNLITIPPLSWTNAAHKSGVKILGTFITEFGPGSKVCEKIFKDEDTMRIFATSLVQIARVFKFDGWLLNIENELPDTAMLKKFVSYLTLSSRKDNPENLVIWYDSVIESGKLHWQNELNDLNRVFFDSCDGIFLNYVWNEEKIKKTVEAAKHRAIDVYVGVDVFGRNTFGGGQFNVFKAAQVIRRHNLSMAIFAPGWTHETLAANPNRQYFYENFINRDTAFWNSLWPYLYTHPITECFLTSFFTGVDTNSFDLFAQQQQLSKIKHPRNIMSVVPNLPTIPTLNNKCNCLECAYNENGLRCLITKAQLNTSLCYVHRIFTCDILLDGTVTVYFLMRNNATSFLSLGLLVSDKNGTLRNIHCNSSAKTDLVDNDTTREINPSTDIALINYVNALFESQLFNEELTVMIYQFPVLPCTLLEVGCTLDDGTSIELCGFGIETKI